jgi:lysophospholipase L1-like esterase
MSRRGLFGTWALLSLSPFFSYFESGLGERTVGAAILVAAGWPLFMKAIRADPSGAVLASFAGSRIGLAFCASAVLLLQLVGGLLSIRFVPVALLACVVLLLFLWARARSPEDLSRSAGNVLLSAGSLCIVVGACELLFRVPAIVALTGGDTPGMMRWEEKNYDRLWEKNLLRLRSFHVDHPKPQGTTRVLAIGDSFTWGDKIAKAEDTWPYVMEAALKRPGRRVEVINMATRGYTTVNEAEALRKLGWAFAPDVLVVQFYLNDTLPSGPNFAREGDRWQFRTWPLAPVGDDVLDAHSYFYSFLSTSFRSMQMGWRHADGYAPLFADDFSGWQDCKTALREIAFRANEMHVPLLVVLFPAFTPGKLDADTYPYAPIHRKVLAALDEIGVQALDLAPVFAKTGKDGKEWWALPCDRHPSVAAQALAGEAITERVEGLLEAGTAAN